MDKFIFIGSDEFSVFEHQFLISGLMNALKITFDEPALMNCEFYESEEIFKKFRSNEKDNSITNKQICPKFRRNFLKKEMKISTFDFLAPFLPDVRAIFCTQKNLHLISQIAQNLGKPLFAIDLDLEKIDEKSIEELKINLEFPTANFIANSAVEEFLLSIDAKKNAHFTSDLRFLSAAREIANFKFDLKNSIGLNLSPKMGKFATEIASEISSEFADKSIFLLPFERNFSQNEMEFLKNIKSEIGNENLILIDENYSANELKWIISQLDAFVCANSSAFIAGISAAVPTVAICDDIKSIGIANDIFEESAEIFLLKDEISIGKILSSLDYALKNGTEISIEIYEKLPFIKKNAQKTAKIIKEFLNN